MCKIAEIRLLESDEKLAIMQYTIDCLAINGYKMIGMDHFEKPEDDLLKAIDAGKLPFEINIVLKEDDIIRDYRAYE
ncbi:MAG: hypothetical protein DSZ04_01105 [Sulfurimonas sp.]|nr:MAG: hypothetical protein DSZ04_01105 [Sulfurimonas sp.]